MEEAVHQPAKWFKHEYSVCSATLRKWHIAGKVSAIRFPGGKRVYNVQAVRELLGTHQPHPPLPINVVQKENFIYARVSSAKQAPDLERQIQELQAAYPQHRVLSDIASGLNFKRKGLRTLLDHVHQGVVGEVVIMYKDRLSRFAEDLLEFGFKKAGVRLVVHSQDHATGHTNELADDLLAITTVFVASHNGRRSAENRRRRRRKQKEAEEAKDGSASPTLETHTS
jgi:predicted site-specific integrase-resolvase